MNFETLGGSELPVSPQMPKPVRDVSRVLAPQSASEVVTLVTGAAGFTGIAQLSKSPILGVDGGKVGSHWLKNLVWGGVNKDLTKKVVKKTGSVKKISTVKKPKPVKKATKRVVKKKPSVRKVAKKK